MYVCVPALAAAAPTVFMVWLWAWLYLICVVKWTFTLSDIITSRTGKKVQLIIREEVAGGQEKSYVNEMVLSGTYSIFNLDQELSKLFVGGLQVFYGIQPEIKYQSFEGEIEELVIGDTPVSLWNFVDAENNAGALERWLVFVLNAYSKAGSSKDRLNIL